MAELIRRVLDLPIQKGYINWEKLQGKLHAALNLVDNKFTKVRDVKTGEDLPVQIDDSLTFSIDVDAKSYTYKLIQPRFMLGDLYASGLQMGYGKLSNVIWSSNIVEF